MSAISGFVRTSDLFIWRVVESISHQYPLLGRVTAIPLAAYTAVRDVTEAPIEGIEEIAIAIWKGDSEHLFYACEDAFYLPLSPFVALADASSTFAKIVLSPAKTARLNADHQEFKQYYDTISDRGSRFDFKYGSMACHRDVKQEIAWALWKAYQKRVYALTDEAVKALPCFGDVSPKAAFIGEVDARFGKYQSVYRIHYLDFAKQANVFETFKKVVIQGPFEAVQALQCPFTKESCPCIQNLNH